MMMSSCEQSLVDYYYWVNCVKGYSNIVHCSILCHKAAGQSSSNLGWNDIYYDLVVKFLSIGLLPLVGHPW